MTQAILVTGAAGFIGFHTALRLLNAGETVVGIDNLNDYYDVALKNARLERLKAFKNFAFVKLNIADLDALKQLWRTHGSFSQVIHLAAQAGVRHSIENPHSYVHSNLVGHVNILEMCRHTDNFEHLVYASSSSVYGANAETPYKASERVDQPLSLYAATKKSDELLSYTYSHLYKLPQTGLRFFTVYGPWGRPDMSYFLFAKAISEGKPIKIFNNGDMKRDFTYIDDIVDGVLAALIAVPDEAVPQRIYNLGNHRSENLMDFVTSVENAYGTNAEKEFLPMQPGDVKETYADLTDTRKYIDYAPKTSISTGVPAFVEWFKEYYAIENGSKLAS